MTNSIKFFWNGIRVDGEKSLNKCSYSYSNYNGEETVSIYADRYGSSLPRDLFEVHNDSDSYTDYFESDHAVLTPDHPLYKYARYAAVKYDMHYLKADISRMEKKLAEFPGHYNEKYFVCDLADKKERLAKLEAMEDPGQPSAEDLEKIHEMKLAAENARIAAEHEEQLKRREEVLRKRNEGRKYIEEVATKHPIKEGEPVVTINWSENPAFYSWDDDELKLSVAAAEIILKHFDEEVHAEGDRGYDKTSFTIHFVNEDGEQDRYEGRYDLGDNDGGMTAHIRAFGSYYAKKGRYGQEANDEDREMGEAIMALADMLEGYVKADNVVKLDVAPWLEEIIKAKDQASDKDLAILMGSVKGMSDQDLTDQVLAIDPTDLGKEPVAEFFIRLLGIRDVFKAMSVYEAWKGQKKGV